MPPRELTRLRMTRRCGAGKDEVEGPSALELEVNEFLSWLVSGVCCRHDQWTRWDPAKEDSEEISRQ